MWNKKGSFSFSATRQNILFARRGNKIGALVKFLNNKYTDIKVQFGLAPFGLHT